MSRYRDMLTPLIALLRTPVGKLRLLGVVGLLGITLVSVEAVSRMFGGSQIVGLTSTNSAGCSCHSTSSSAGTTLSLTSGSGSFTVEQSSSTSFTVSVSNSSQTAAGVAVAAKTTSTGNTNVGTLSVANGSGLQVVSSEITHDGPKTMSSGTSSWTFSWTAPSAHGTYFIQAIGNAVNNNGFNTGDNWNWMTAQTVTVAGVALTAPNSGTFCAGTSMTISWTSTSVANVKIDLSSDGGSSYPTTLNASVASGTGGTESYSWAIPSTQPAGTNYRIRVSDAATATRLDASDASFSIITPPSITNQPAGQTVCVNDGVSITVAASGSNLAYQWRRNSTNIVGATSSTFSIPGAVVGDAGSYDVQISNACSTITSSSVTLVVNAAPSISQQPTATAACVGQPASFTVQAAGTNLTYQWRKGGNAITGATSATYSIGTASTGDAGNYDVVISGTCNPSRTSNAVALTVRALPQITGHPLAQTVCAGQPASFSVSASGTTLTYQWRRNGTNITGATGATYNIGSAGVSQAGNYDVVVSGACTPAVTSNQAALTVNPTPAFSSDPFSQVACEGSDVVLTGAASGSGVTYQWRKNGLDIAGATSSTYTITAVDIDDLGGYDVVATQGDCFSISGTAIITMLRPAAITGQPTDKSAVAGSNISLSVTATGDDVLYQWKKNGTNVAGATSATLELNNVQVTDGGSYTVEVRNACTTLVSNAATVTVLAPGAGAVLSLSPSTVDFGPVRVSVQKELTLDGVIRNAGDSVLTITSIGITGANAGDFSMTPITLPVTIAPGSNQSMTIRFTPSAAGARNASVAFTSNSKAAASLALVGNGAFGSLTALSPNVIIGRVVTGSMRDTTIELCNNSEVAVQVLSLSLSSGAPFSILAPTSLPMSIAPHECLDVTIRFAPTSEGSATSSLTISTDGQPSDVVLALSGDGGLSAAPIEESAVASLVAMPNPATESVSIEMTLLRPLAADVLIVDARGTIVRRFDSREVTSIHRFAWDGRSDAGTPVSSGTYRIVARTAGETKSTAVVIAR